MIARACLSVWPKQTKDKHGKTRRYPYSPFYLSETHCACATGLSTNYLPSRAFLSHAVTLNCHMAYHMVLYEKLKDSWLLSCREGKEGHIIICYRGPSSEEADILLASIVASLRGGPPEADVTQQSSVHSCNAMLSSKMLEILRIFSIDWQHHYMQNKWPQIAIMASISQYWLTEHKNSTVWKYCTVLESIFYMYCNTCYQNNITTHWTALL